MPCLVALLCSFAIVLPHAVQASPYFRQRATASTAQLPLSILNDYAYTAQISVGTEKFNVTLDTAGSDLAIQGAVQQTTDTKLPANVSFADSSFPGKLSFANITLGGLSTVENQGYIHTQPSGPNPIPGNGVLGLGPSSASLTRAELVKSNQTAGIIALGNTLLDHIFQQSPNTTPFVTLLLARAGDPGNTMTSQFTIGTTVSPFGNISGQPQLPVVRAAAVTSQLWTITLDSILNASGTKITTTTSVVSSTPSGKLVASLDTGTAISLVPAGVAASLYAGVNGASYSDADGLWHLPCDAEIGASVVFGGKTMVVHPLDVNVELGNGTCVGGFAPITDEAISQLNNTADLILGANFLRNTYALLNYGNFITSASDSNLSLFVQLLSITDPTQAQADFVHVRGASSTSPPSSPSTSSSLSAVQRALPAIIILPIVFAIGMAILGFLLYRRRQAQSYTSINRSRRTLSLTSGGIQPYTYISYPLLGSTSSTFVQTQPAEGEQYADATGSRAASQTSGPRAASSSFYSSMGPSRSSVPSFYQTPGPSRERGTAGGQPGYLDPYAVPTPPQWVAELQRNASMYEANYPRSKWSPA